MHFSNLVFTEFSLLINYLLFQSRSYLFLFSTECAYLANTFLEEQIDGQAFMLLNLPTVQQYLRLKIGPAIRLCHIIERVKLGFFLGYCARDEDDDDDDGDDDDEDDEDFDEEEGVSRSSPADDVSAAETPVDAAEMMEPAAVAV